MQNIEAYYGNNVLNCPDLARKVFIVFDPLMSFGYTTKGHGENITVASTGTSRNILPFLPTFSIQINAWRGAFAEEEVERAKIPRALIEDKTKNIDQTAIIAAGVRVRPHIAGLIAAMTAPAPAPAAAAPAAPVQVPAAPPAPPAPPKGNRAKA
jgi:hypothetical protein